MCLSHRSYGFPGRCSLCKHMIVHVPLTQLGTTCFRSSTVLISFTWLCSQVFSTFFFIHYPFHEVIALLEPGNRFYIIVFCLYNLTRSFMVVDIIVLDKQSAIFETKTTTESTRSFKTRSLFIFQSSNSIKWNAPPKYRRGTAWYLFVTGHQGIWSLSLFRLYKCYDGTYSF